LERWLAGEPIQARPASLPVRAQRWVKRNPVGAALIVSLFFGLSTALGFLVALSDQIKTANLNKAIEREASLQKFNDHWAFPSVTNLVIQSELLASIRDDKPRQFVEGRDIRIKFGLSTDQSPLSRAHSAAALLGELEHRMGLDLHRNMFIDLQMSKATHNEAQPLSAREADVQRLDALTYVHAHALDPRIIPIAIENDADEIVFCVLRNSVITNLTQLAGKTIGFGDADSSATVLAQNALLAHGIRAGDLKPIKYLTNLFLVSTNRLLDFGSAEIMTDMREIKSGREALRYLLEGKVDAAVTLKRYFELRRHRGVGLRMIGRVDGMPEVFATHTGLEPDVREALANSMAALKDTPGLGILSSFRTVSALIPTNDSYFEGLRLALTNVQQRFSTGVISSAPPSRTALR
jgi:ABC-type phosphate/phosphonate transport system substrate-binding protein